MTTQLVAIGEARASRRCARQDPPVLVRRRAHEALRQRTARGMGRWVAAARETFGVVLHDALDWLVAALRARRS